jgi:hypothetical protein
MIEHDRQTKALAVFFLYYFDFHTASIFFRAAGDIDKAYAMSLFIFFGGTRKVILLLKT